MIDETQTDVEEQTQPGRKSSSTGAYLEDLTRIQILRREAGFKSSQDFLESLLDEYEAKKKAGKRVSV